MPDYETQEYWHARFESESAFEWLVPSRVFIDILDSYLQSLPRDTSILQLGLGTSDLHVHLRKKGFTSITNIDFEPLAIERGQQLEMDVFGDIRMKYLVADATRLDNLDGQFQLVIDKSTADAIGCSEEGAVLSMTKAVARNLTPNGVWVSLSFSAWRFDFETGKMPLAVETISKIATPKRKQHDPDIFFYCYMLRHG